MLLDKGIAEFARAQDESGTGNLPPDTGEAYLYAWYGERTVGMSRYFAAKQANDRIDRMIRILYPREDTVPSPDDICDLPDGYRYRIVQVQSFRDEEAGENVLDISLERIGAKYGCGK